MLICVWQRILLNSRNVESTYKRMMNYFGKYNLSAMQYTLQCIKHRIVKWAMCKYKNLRRHKRAEE